MNERLRSAFPIHADIISNQKFETSNHKLSSKDFNDTDLQLLRGLLDNRYFSSTQSSSSLIVDDNKNTGEKLQHERNNERMKTTAKIDVHRRHYHALLESVLEHDQLRQQRCLGKAFIGFQEGDIIFPPTFKYDKGSSRFDSGAKMRCPAWTDRILYHMGNNPSIIKTPSTSDKKATTTSTQLTDSSNSTAAINNNATGFLTNNHTDSAAEALTNNISSPITTPVFTAQQQDQFLELIDYFSVDVRSSDHRPVCAKFTVNV